MKQTLQLKMGQHLTMTPQLQQAIRLLQLSTLDLQAEIQEALETNPLLETLEASEDPDRGGDENDYQDAPGAAVEANETVRAEETTAADAIPTDLPVDTNWDDVWEPTAGATGSSSGSGSGDEYNDFETYTAATETLHDHLMWQLNLTPMSDTDRLIATAIIDSIDQDGLLNASVEELTEGFDTALEIESDEVLAVLHMVQNFDPAGVGAADLRECLLLQLRMLDVDLAGIKLARQIVDRHLNLLGSRDYNGLMRRLRVTEDELRDAVNCIQLLNPRPGSLFENKEVEYVVPDVLVFKDKDRWRVELNPEIAPKLRVNSYYAGMIKRGDSSEANTYLRNNLQEARWFIKSLQSRNETLLKVATCIVERQQGFLDHGAEAMKPMILADIAEAVSMHESTISRVTTQKYMHTPGGIFELKYFFSSHVSTASGGECSSVAIRAIIKKLVAAENTRKPLSDSKIAKLLEDQGINVARRTIAKYRESLGIAPSNERKQLV